MVASCGKTMVKGRATYEVDKQLSIEIWDHLWIYDLFLLSMEKYLLKTFISGKLSVANAPKIMMIRAFPEKGNTTINQTRSNYSRKTKKRSWRQKTRIRKR
jgi:hypothetical protein